MNATLLLKNRRGRRASPRVSLFPFLAVLICTMGALVLLLFAVMRQARAQAHRAAAAKAVQQQADWQSEREAVRWRAEQIRDSHKKTSGQLTDLRLNLGHLEDHARRLRERIKQLESASGSADQTVRRRLAATQEELQKAQAQLAEAQRGLADARKAVELRPRSYAIIPYEGPNQTRRRPIYIECRADAVVLQPEGVALRAADFEGPPGPGNPLAAALRAVREHLVSQGAFDPERDGEPYPLLLVRPSGIIAYYAARAAVQDYASDFGYEFVGDDWSLRFPPPDARLAATLTQVVESARRRQQELIAAAPTGYRGRSRGVYRVSPMGGLMRDDGLADDEDDGDRPSFQRAQPAGRYGSQGEPNGPSSPGNAAATGSGFGGGQEAGGPSGSGGSGSGPYPGGRSGSGPLAGGGSGSGPYAGDGPSLGGPAGGSSSGSSGPGPYSSGGPEVGRSYAGGGTGADPSSGGPSGTATPYPSGAVAQQSAPGGNPAGTMPGSGPNGSTSPGGAPAGSSAAMGAAPGADGSSPASAGGQQARGSAAPLPEGYVAGRPFEATQSRRPPPADAEPGTPLRPGEWYPTERPPPEPPHKPEKPETEQQRRRTPQMSLAEKRGRDWALRKANSSVPITRPIRLECYSDRLVIAADPGAAPIPPIFFDARTERSVDRLTTAIWEHMDSWGIAGHGMYWRPVLKVRVAPGGEQRFAELSGLLEGSGMTVQREP